MKGKEKEKGAKGAVPVSLFTVKCFEVGRLMKCQHSTN